ncbi:hypothetical protein BDV12DRAFT_198918 [Aspergillus spectabilis]
MSRKGTKISAICYRIILFANLLSITAYGAVTPSQLSKVTSDCIAIGIAGFAMAVQVYITWAVYGCFLHLPYDIWAVVALDAICGAGWVAAIAVLSYWDREVVYLPQRGDPGDWFDCFDAKYWQKVMTDDGPGHWVNPVPRINPVWCEVEINGLDRLVGNGAARQQLHVLTGLSARCYLQGLFCLGRFGGGALIS